MRPTAAGPSVGVDGGVLRWDGEGGSRLTTSAGRREGRRSMGTMAGWRVYSFKQLDRKHKCLKMFSVTVRVLGGFQLGSFSQQGVGEWSGG